MDIIIRPAVKEDYAGVKKLMVQSLQHHSELRPDTYRLSEEFFGIEEYTETLEKAHILVATDKENIVGLVSYSVGEIKAASVYPFRRIMVDELVVDINCRRAGIATMLMDAVHQAAKENKADRIQLNVNALNSGAISLYEKQGFVPEMIRMEYILDKEG
ncbi:MAG: GNAT family N-acetyltransferase [Oscillospiraceae bacterium]|nr:GNAT family N-acetyltransferase [Oscillospiraceae bacterium]